MFSDISVPALNFKKFDHPLPSLDAHISSHSWWYVSTVVELPFTVTGNSPDAACKFSICSLDWAVAAWSESVIGAISNITLPGVIPTISIWFADNSKYVKRLAINSFFLFHQMTQSLHL